MSQKRFGTCRSGGERISLSRSMCKASAISSSESSRGVSLLGSSWRAASASARSIAFTLDLPLPRAEVPATYTIPDAFFRLGHILTELRSLRIDFADRHHTLTQPSPASGRGLIL